MSSSTSSSSSSSSSSLSSLLDSNTSSMLGASTWNQQKSKRPVRGRSLWENDASFDEIYDNPGSASSHLLRKIAYPSLIEDSNPNHAEERIIQEEEAVIPTETMTEKQNKSEIELVVLLDCLSNHFLFSQWPPHQLKSLVKYFEKCKFRNHEIITRQGDPPDFFYVLYSGDVRIMSQEGNGNTTTHSNDDTKNDSESSYTVFGDLALLTRSPHEKTVQANSTVCTLFRLGRIPFQRALVPSPPIASSAQERLQLIRAAIPTELVEYLDDETTLKKLVAEQTVHKFQKGDTLIRKDRQLHSLVIIAKGLVVATDISLGGRSYEDMPIGPGQARTSFGWQSLVATTDDEPHFNGTILARTDGAALVLSKEAFHNALGVGGGDKTRYGLQQLLQHLAAKRLARMQLQQIPVFKDSALDEMQINGLLDLMHCCEYTSSSSDNTSNNDDETTATTIFKAGEKVEAAMYFVRKGAVTLEFNKGQTRQIVEAGGYFGETKMLLDQNKDGQKHYIMRSPMTAMAHSPHAVLDILYLEECRNVVNTTLLGLGTPATVSAIDTSILWTDLQRHTILGAGKFGQVWLASTPFPSSSSKDETFSSADEEQHTDTNKESKNGQRQRRMVALKVQAKHPLVQSSEHAQRVVAERNILASLHSPFIIRLFQSFQDESRLYMITSLLQGGELESIIPPDGISEKDAKFYAAGILEGLTYLHRRHIIHRDLKTANVLINEKGYPVLIDLGFAKYVPDKTFTFCGSPMFTAPEIIRYKGHDKGCDHWSWAVLVYKMVTGRFPFYAKGMGDNELALYKRICKGTFELDGLMSVEFRMLMVAVLYPDPAQRLGSKVNGWRDIFGSPWFSDIDLRRLRKQELPAPWVPPTVKDPLDASRFHPSSKVMEDLMSNESSLPTLSNREQDVFRSFGPIVSNSSTALLWDD